MAQLTTRQLVTQLERQGHIVKYYVRKDGGILIQSINGQKFSGAKGNIYARTLLGEKFSERREAQLKKITRERVRTPRKIPVETPEDLERFRKRVMRKWRKAGLKGSISKRNLRKIIEKEGFTKAKTYLEEMERHTEGKAYTKQIEIFLAKVQQDYIISGDEWFNMTYELVNENRDLFSPIDMFNLSDLLYDVEKPSNPKVAHDLYVAAKDLIESKNKE